MNRPGRGGAHGPPKRKRDDGALQAPEDPSTHLLRTILVLGDTFQVRSLHLARHSQSLCMAATSLSCAQGQERPPVEEEIDALHRALRRELGSRGPVVQRHLLDCAVELSTKTPIYATLIGLLNTDDSGFVARLLEQAHRECNAALQSCRHADVRLHLRLFTALTQANVLHPSAAVGALRGVVQAALAIAQSQGAGEDAGRAWQPYTDSLVHAALCALPWGGCELQESVPAEVSALLADAATYLELRPRQHQPALRPFLAPLGDLGDADAAAASDSGGASFLTEVYEAVRELLDTLRWRVENIPAPHRAFEAVLATGVPHDLPPLSVPATMSCLSAECTPAEAAAIVLKTFPPRGSIRLLPDSDTLVGKPRVERLVAEEYIRDTLARFEGSRMQCAARLALGLPVPYKHVALLAEGLFSQLFRLPEPEFKPLAYSTIMVDITKLQPTFTRSLSACIREIFARMSVLDPQLRVTLAEWLAYHLSNFEFQWPWDRWKQVLTAPPHDAQRHFVVATLSRLIRLSYWQRVQQALPDSFQTILPPKPEVVPLPALPAPGAEGAPLSNGTHAEANGGMSEKEEPPAGAAAGEGASQEAQIARRAAEILQLVRQKAKGDALLEAAQRAPLGGDPPGGADVAPLRALLRALLVAGAKSFTHLLTALERYLPQLQRLFEAAGAEAEVAAVGEAAAVWAAGPQRAAQAVDRLMALRLVGGRAIVRWALGSPGARSLGDATASLTAWEVLHIALAKTIARTQDAREDAAGARATLTACRAQAAAAAEAAAAAAEPEAEAKGQEAEQAQQRVAELEGAVQQEERELEAAAREEADALLLLFTLLRDALVPLQASVQAHAGDALPPGQDVGQVGMEAALKAEAQASRAAVFDALLAHLHSCARRYYAAIAPIAPQLEQEVYAGVDERIRGVLVECLHL